MWHCDDMALLERLPSHPIRGQLPEVEHGSKAWHDRRRAHPTATQIRDTLGLGYAGSSLLSVYQYRAGIAADIEPSLLMLRGIAFEPYIIAEWARRHKVQVDLPCQVSADGVMASLDAWAGYPVEAKCRDLVQSSEYRDGAAPPGDVCQSVVQALVTGATHTVLVTAMGEQLIERLVLTREGAEICGIDPALYRERETAIWAAVDAIGLADAEGMPAVADWLLRLPDWETWRRNCVVEATALDIDPDLALVLAEAEKALAAARAGVRGLEAQRAEIYARIALAAGGVGVVRSGGVTLKAFYTREVLSGWKVAK